MKKISAVLAVFLLLLTACGDSSAGSAKVEKTFQFLSLSWGDTWETVQASDALRGAETETAQDDDLKLSVRVKNISFGGKTVELGLLFSKDPYTAGLNQVIVLYQEEDEADLLQELTAVYGERRDSFPDENGMENPLQFAGWYTEDTLRGALKQAGKEDLIDSLAETGVEETRLDAILRQPLVTIGVDEENNMIQFDGTESAIVKNAKEQ